MKKQEVRCTNTVTAKKSGKEVTCGRFLFEITEDYIRTRCPNCGAIIQVQKDSFGKYYQTMTPKGNGLMDCAHEKE